MKIAANFDNRVVVHSESIPWIESPMKGVTRRPLDRVGAEVARATSIVRYAAGSHFKAHTHTGGEEFVVLEGVFQDEHGDYPIGSYIRNPPQSSHTPRSEQGCIIFVKLWQFQPQDRTHVCIHIDEHTSYPHLSCPGITTTSLYSDEHETVSVMNLDANAIIDIANSGGIEVLVLHGELYEKDDCLVKHSWLRLPVGSALKATAGESGAKIWIKTGHLLDVKNQILRLESL